MRMSLFGFLTIIAVAAGLSIASVGAHSDKKTDSPGVAGTWTLSVDTPHGPAAMSLVLAQDGRHVKGTFASPHGDLPVEGELVDGTLTLATTSTDPDALKVTFTVKLDDHGTLSGYLSGPMGDMKCTAQRATGK